MIKYSYYSDSRHNYLVVPCSEATGDYQYRMLAANKIRGLLPSSIRSIDGDNFLYYDITSRQSLSVLFRDKKAEAADIKRILYGVAAAGDVLSDYLLDHSMLIMNPEFVFYDFVQEEYCFVYFPEATEGSSLHLLASYLADRVNMDDKEAAAMVFHIADLSSNDTFILKKAFLDKEYEQQEKRLQEAENEDRETKPADLVFDQEQKWWDSGELTEEEEEENEEEEQVTDEKPHSSGKNKLSGILILSIVFLVLAISLEAARRFVPMNASLKLTAAAGVVSFLALAMIVAIYGTIVSRRQNKIEVKEEQEAYEEQQKSRLVPAKEYTAEKTDFRGNADPCFLTEEAGEYVVNESGPGKLYGTGEARSYRVDFASLPCTVGNLKGFCDVLIGDKSVSGLHVRFRKTDEEEIEMTDLNSTMGTYLNGRRLLPNESAVICRGDEVKIGRLEFCYR